MGEGGLGTEKGRGRDKMDLGALPKEDQDGFGVGWDRQGGLRRAGRSEGEGGYEG